MKISNPATNLDSTGRNWYTKVEPLYSDFITASISNFKPGKNVSVDEQFILFEGRLRHSMQIGTKTAGVGFKIYSLCLGNYLYNFLFVSRVAKINKLKKKSGLTDSSSIIYRLCETLPADRGGYVVFMDSFFSNVKLFTALKDLSIGAV